NKNRLLHTHDECTHTKSTTPSQGKTCLFEVVIETGRQWAHFDRRPLGGWAALCPGDGFVSLHVLQQEKSANHFLGFGKRPIAQGRLTGGPADTNGLGGGSQ